MLKFNILVKIVFFFNCNFFTKGTVLSNRKNELNIFKMKTRPYLSESYNPDTSLKGDLRNQKCPFLNGGLLEIMSTPTAVLSL